MMHKNYLTVKDLANAVGCHVNTVHLYESWGFLPPVPRDPKNQYRMYSEYHLEHFKLAYNALKYPYSGGKQVVLDLVEASKLQDLERALSLTQAYREQINAEREQADAAIDVIERWLSGVQESSLEKPLWIGQAAELH